MLLSTLKLHQQCKESKTDIKSICDKKQLVKHPNLSNKVNRTKKIKGNVNTNLSSRQTSLKTTN